MAVPPLKLPPLPSGQAIVDPKSGAPTNTYQIWWQQFSDSIEYSINGIAAALAAAGIALDAAEIAMDAADAAQLAADNAQTAADNANAAVASTNSAVSLANSGVVNEAGPLEAISTGTVTIANHDRLYGDQTLNPTVAVTGDTLSSGFSSGDIVYVYYLDPTRAGGAVSYLFSLDPADVVQAGSTHSVGVVEIPAGPTATGIYVRPSGVIPT